jgi:hypothetical protein
MIVRINAFDLDQSKAHGVRGQAQASPAYFGSLFCHPTIARNDVCCSATLPSTQRSFDRNRSEQSNEASNATLYPKPAAKDFGDQQLDGP